MAEKRMKLLEEAKQNILVPQIKQKRDYDRRHAKPHLFNTGKLVLKKDFTQKRQKGGKLDMKFVGPYEIGKKLMNGVYELISPNGNTI